MFPPEIAHIWLQFLIIAVGFAVMLRSRRMMRSIGWSALGVIVFSVLLALIDPTTRVVLTVVAIPFIVLRLLERLLRALLGAEAAGMIIGTWAIRLFDFMVFLPGATYRGIRFLWRGR